MQGNGARSRYSQSFQSSIFEPLPTPQGPALVPAGRRRDLTTEEMWGSHVEKDLKAAPKTFAPRDPGVTAKQRFLKSLVTGVLPGLPGPEHAAEAPPPSRGGPAEQPALDEEPAVADGEARSPERGSEADDGARPEPDSQGGRSPPPPWDAMTHAERSYVQKCSGLFDRPTPADAGGMHREVLRQRREDELAGERARRTDPRYSDIFHQGRGGRGGAEREARWKAAPEDRIGVHMDWTDSKTELLGARRPQTADGPPEASGAVRRGDGEFRGTVDMLAWPARAAEHRRSPHDGAHREPRPVTEDNSHKLKGSAGCPTSQIHQAHLRSSLLSDTFYSEAESAKHWRVVELHVSGLPRATGNEDMVRNLCQGLDLQIVRVLVEMDPVHNQCKGRAKIVVRYNPDRDNLDSLVDQLQAANLRVSQ